MHFGPGYDKKFCTEWETLIAPSTLGDSRPGKRLNHSVT
jgi:hypothetical protein